MSKHEKELFPPNTLVTMPTEEANKAFEEISQEYRTIASEHQSSIDFNKGIMLGLLYGIIGNIFVQFFYPVIDAIARAQYDLLFASNATISIAALTLIIYLTIKFWNDISRHKKDKKVALDKADAFHQASQRKE